MQFGFNVLKSPFSYFTSLAGVIVHDEEPLPVPFWSRSRKGDIEMCPNKLREKLSVPFFYTLPLEPRLSRKRLLLLNATEVHQPSLYCLSR